jgi:hypothetical protein
LALGFLAVTTFPAGFHLDRLTEFLTGCCALLVLAWEGEVWDFMHSVAPHKFCCCWFEQRVQKTLREDTADEMTNRFLMLAVGHVVAIGCYNQNPVEASLPERRSNDCGGSAAFALNAPPHSLPS